MNHILLALLALTLPLAAQAGKPHMKTADQDCAECHSAQEKVWLDGKHGLMGVKCVVCHGTPEKNFDPKPGLNRCRGCHAEAVLEVEKKMPAKDQTCFSCHDHHTVALTKEQNGPFHAKGGK